MDEYRGREYRRTTPGRRQRRVQRLRRRFPHAQGTERSLSAFGIIWPATVATLDAATGRHAILLVLLGFGPCITVLSERPVPTIVAGLLAVASAVACGVPDGIFGTGEHLLLIASIAAVAGVAVAMLTTDTSDGPPTRSRRR